MRTLFRVLLTLGAISAVVSQGANAEVPNRLTYQGTLTDSVGNPVTGQRTISFRLFTVAAEGDPFFVRTETLTLDQGRLSVVLAVDDDDQPLEPDDLTGDTFIEIVVAGDSPMPRQRVSSVAYAIRAGYAERAPDELPRGVIVMWSGTATNVPSGWALCNGENGTPNLQNRFIVGAGGTYPIGASEGGGVYVNLTHNHSIGNDSPGTTWQTDHWHWVEGSTTTIRGEEHTVDDKDSSDKRHVGGNDHYHDFGALTNAQGGHSHTVNAHKHGGTTGNGGTDSLDNRPPYYAIAFIMKL